MLNRTTLRRGVCGLVFVAAAGAAHDADAAVTLVSRLSTMSTQVTGQSQFGGPAASDSDSNGTNTFNPFNDTISATTSDQIVTPLAESEAFQNSIVQLSGAAFTGAEGQGTAEALVQASPNDFASAHAGTVFRIRFSVPAGESYNYTLSGALGTDGSGATAQLYFDRIAPTYEEQFFRAGDAGAYSTDGTLGPGTYELQATAEALGTEDLPGNPFSDFSVDLDLTPIPEPAALALFALPAALTARRRR